MLVFNQGLDGGGLALNHVHQVIHHAPLAAHNQIQIAQAHVKVNHAGFVSLQRQTRCDAGGGGGFAHAAFA